MLTMKVAEFIKHFDIVSAGCATRSPSEIYKFVHISSDANSLVMAATDSELSIRKEIVGDIDKWLVEQPFSMLLPAFRILEILRLHGSDEQMRFYPRDGINPTLKTISAQYDLLSPAPKGFAEIPPFDSENYLQINGATLKAMIAQTKFSTDDKATNYATGNLQFRFQGNELKIASTDSKRLSLSAGLCSVVGSAPDRYILIPGKTTRLLEKSIDPKADVQIAWMANSCSFKIADMTIRSGVGSGKFPDFDRVMPDEKSFVGRLNLVTASVLPLVRQALLACDGSHAIFLNFTTSNLKVRSESEESGLMTSQIPIVYEGPEINMRIDGRNVAEYLKTTNSSDQVEIGLKGAEEILFARVGNWRHVMMPLAAR